MRTVFNGNIQNLVTEWFEINNSQLVATKLFVQKRYALTILQPNIKIKLRIIIKDWKQRREDVIRLPRLHGQLLSFKLNICLHSRKDVFTATFTIFSHCVPLPAPGPPKTKITIGLTTEDMTLCAG